jgi:hypothetical protein
MEQEVLVTFDEHGVAELNPSLEPLGLDGSMAALVSGGTNISCIPNFVCLYIAQLPASVDVVCVPYGVYVGDTNAICGGRVVTIEGGSGPSSNAVCG